jgi:hypothetical protein
MDFGEQFHHITQGVELNRPLPRLHRRLSGIYEKMYEGRWPSDHEDGPVTGEEFKKLTSDIADNTIERAFHPDPMTRRLNRQFIGTLLTDYK